MDKHTDEELTEYERYRQQNMMTHYELLKSSGFSTEPLMSDNRRGSGEECTDDHGCGFENEKQDDMADGNSHCQNENEKIQDLVDPKIASDISMEVDNSGKSSEVKSKEKEKECPSSKTFEESVIKHTSEEKDDCVAEMSEDGQRECIGLELNIKKEDEVQDNINSCREKDHDNGASTNDCRGSSQEVNGEVEVEQHKEVTSEEEKEGNAIVKIEIDASKNDCRGNSQEINREVEVQQHKEVTEEEEKEGNAIVKIETDYLENSYYQVEDNVSSDMISNESGQAKEASDERIGVHGNQFDAENKEGNTSGDEKESEGKDLKESSNDIAGQCSNCSRMISHDALEDHKLTCRPTMIDESKVMLTEVKILDGEVLLVARSKRKRSCKVKTCNYSCCKTRRASKNITKSETEVETKLNECPECHGTFTTEQSLKTHMLIHTGEKPYKCEHCEYRCSTKRSLKRHNYIHTGEKPYACEYCDKRFNQKNHLKRHYFTHTGEKPFKCSECDYRTSEKYHLSRHMFVHTGEKPHECHLCDYRSSTYFKLKTHLMTHSKNKPFTCDVCGYGAVRKQDLQKHMFRHKKIKLFKCEDCDYRGATARDLKDHLDRNTKKHREQKAAREKGISKYPTVMQSIIEKYTKNNSAEKEE